MIDKWDDQPNRVEVWVEKDALEGVIEPACRDLDIDFFSCRGYASQTAVWDAAQRFIRYAEAGQEVHILHLGDHDPSGVNMTEDILKRLDLFTGGQVQVNRIALNMDQVKRYNPPPSPAKITDSRAADYIERFGEDSWELDALKPEVIDKLIRDNVEELRDDDLYESKLAQEQEEKAELAKLSKRWTDVRSYLRKLK